MNEKIGIIGSGSWGLALALAMHRSKVKISVLVKSKSYFKTLNKYQKSHYLPSISIPNSIKFTLNYNDLRDSKYIFLVTPSQSIRGILEKLKLNKVSNNELVICSKGIEQTTGKLLSEVTKEIFPNTDPIILSGPNLALEVAKGLPTAFVLSCKSSKKIKKLGKLISTENFRPYFNNDLIGTQIGGSVKNIIAIACGIVVGRQLGENARASILTRGLKEIIFLGKYLGAKRKTFHGLSGFGDLNLSCSSMKSRNMKFGYFLGKGNNIKLATKKVHLTEGVYSTKAICLIGEKLSIELPICMAVNNILMGRSIDKEILSLLSRPLKFEG